MVLPRLTVLDGRYAIGGTLDATEPLVFAYQAWNLHTEDQVILEEFFPAPLVRRCEGGLDVEATEAAHEEVFQYGRDQFLKETAVLAAIKHPNLVDALEHFEANGTAYRVLAYHKGATLESVLSKQGGKLPLKMAFTILMPLLNGLQAAHQRGLIHGAFSPPSIFLAKGRGPMLRGFRTTHVMMAQRTGDRQHLVMEGTSAPEQYEAKGRQGPWTDIYGSAATLYQVLAGRTLPSAPRRLEKDDVPALVHALSNVPDAVRQVLEQALSLDLARRPRSVQSFRQQLLDAVKQTARSQAPPARPVAKVPETPTPDSKPQPAPDPIEEPVKPVSEKPPVKLVSEEPPVKPVAEEPPVKIVAEKPPVKVVAEEPPVTEELPVKPVAEELPVVAIEEDITPKPSAPSKPVSAREEREDRAAQEMAVESAKKQTARKEFVAKVTAQTQEKDKDKPPKRRSKRPPTRKNADRQAVRSRRGMPVLAALAVVVLVAFSGAYVLMQGENSELGQFAYYRAKGDSLFAVANYMDAKTQYEFALAAAPNNEYVEGRLNETQQRLVEVQDIRYVDNVARGDVLYAEADSMLKAGNALGALSFFAEANKAYYEALRYRPDDSVVLEKGKLTSSGMEEALSRTHEQNEQAAVEPDPRALREELYKSYRQQADQLLAQENYAGAREKYSRALEERPNDDYARAKVEEIDAHLEAVGLDEQFEQFVQQGDDFISQERYAEAEVAFQKALDIKPDNRQARDGLDRAGRMLEDAKRDEYYQQFRNQGDALFREKNYEEARARYEGALAVKPGDDYVQRKIQEIEQAVAAQQPAPQEVAPAPEEPEQAAVPEDGIYTVVDEAPELIGGLVELHRKVTYPEMARRMRTEGRVYVQFVVTEEGTVQDAAVVRGIGNGCDEEALRVVKEARFVPGKIQGKPVKVRHTVFINFQMQ